MSTDPGVKDTLSYMIARDTMHQNQWLAAIEELKDDGLEGLPVPSSFPQDLRKAGSFLPVSGIYQKATRVKKVGWAKGTAPDGKGEFVYLENPEPQGPEAEVPAPHPKLYATGKE